MDWAKATARHVMKNIIVLGFGVPYIRDLTVIQNNSALSWSKISELKTNLCHTREGTFSSLHSKIRPVYSSVGVLWVLKKSIFSQAHSIYFTQLEQILNWIEMVLTCLTQKQLEVHRCILIIVVTDALVLKAPGHQYPQCWLKICFSGPALYRNITFIGDNMRKSNQFWKKKPPSCLRVNSLVPGKVTVIFNL